MDTTAVNTAEIMRQLQQELPLNDFGLPTGIYRSDLLPFHQHRSQLTINRSQLGQTLLPQEPSTVGSEHPPVDLPLPDVDGSEDPADSLYDTASEGIDAESMLAGDFPMAEHRPRQDRALEPVLAEPVEYRIAGFPGAALQVAFVPLQYDEGFPAFESGAAFWDKMVYEPSDAFQMFQRYCMMTRGTDPDHEDVDNPGEAASGARSISTLVSQSLNGQGDDVKILMLIDKLKEYSHIYYWNLRVRAYDLYRITQYHQQQELRAIETQDDHYIQARKLRHKLMDYFDSDEDFWDLMTPKVGVDFLKTLTQLERISAGVPAAGPAGENERSGQSFEVALRTIAQTHGSDRASSHVLDEEGTVLEKALEDPHATEILQELIIRTSGGGEK